MKNAVVAAITLIAAAALAGCSSDNQSPTTPSSSAAVKPAAGPAYTDVTPGTPFLISNAKGTTGMVTVDKIEVNPACTTKFGARPAPAGTNVALELDVQTNAIAPTKYISEAWFSELTPDGYTKKLQTADDLCIADRDHFGSDYQPNSKYHGWVLVQVSNPASSLLMSDIWDGRPTPEVHRIPIS